MLVSFCRSGALVALLATCSQAFQLQNTNKLTFQPLYSTYKSEVVNGFTGTLSVEVAHYSEEVEEYGINRIDAGAYRVKTYNAISPKGLGRFDDKYLVQASEDQDVKNSHAILLRSYKLQEEDVDVTVRAIARCGAGTNNIPVDRMTELGIPVFNTPGANANAVKELVICGMLLASRRIVDGINHMKDLGEQGLAKERVEKDKAQFGGREISGKTLGVVGLGAIGTMIARDASMLGMKIIGYDPYLSVDNALKLPHDITITDDLSVIAKQSDYITLNVPYIKGENGTHGMINNAFTQKMKTDAVVLNFARGELVESEAMKNFLDNGFGRYVTDFPEDLLWGHENCIVLPHLGASTGEAEEQAASMAADTICAYLEEGVIRNSVNFPNVNVAPRGPNTYRLTVINRNCPGVLSKITGALADKNLNIMQQINQSRGNIAYNVIDVDPSIDSDSVNVEDLQKELTMIEGVLSTRLLFGAPGSGYARNIDGKYYV